MSQTIYIPRLWGGTIILTITPVSTPEPTLLVVATFRSGEQQATFRSGEVQAGGR